MILLNLCFLAVKAQEMPEVYLLWPDGPEENNGLADQEITESNGNITFNSTAKLHVYHPEKEIQNGIAVIICPGGGYSFLSMEYEGRMFAQWLIKQGITAIILQYRMPAQHDRIPLADAQRAMRWVRNRAENWGINPDKVGIAGFSAGGHLASTLATHFDQGKTKATDSLERFSSGNFHARKPDSQRFTKSTSGKNACSGKNNGLFQRIANHCRNTKNISGTQ